MLKVFTNNDTFTFRGEGAKEVHNAIQNAGANNAAWAFLQMNDGKQFTFVLSNIVAMEFVE